MSYRVVIFTYILLMLFSTTSLAQSSASCTDYPRAMAYASQIRGLKAPENLCCNSVNKEEYLRYANEVKEGELNLEGEAKSLELLGITEPSFDYEACLTKDTAQNVNALYSPVQKCVFIPESVNTEFHTLVHEATHALQDKHFNLQKLSKNIRTNDSYSAMLAVVEGDAAFVENLYLKENPAPEAINSNVESEDAFMEGSDCVFPEALLSMFDFPYSFGQLFIKHYYDLLGNKGVNQLLSNMPHSTEQILYKSKHNRYSLQKINLPSCGKGRKEIYHDVLGEYFLRSLFRPQFGSAVALNAARGWDGDKLSLCKDSKTDSYELRFMSAWETPKDRLEFFTTLREFFKKRYEISLYPQVRELYFEKDKYKVKLRFAGENNVELFVVG